MDKDRPNTYVKNPSCSLANHLFTGTSELTELYLIDDIALTIVFGSGGAGKTANFLSRSTNSGTHTDIFFSGWY